MQIIRTEIAKATALTGEQIVRVLFCGEGGDCVTVDMAKVELEADEAALDRARAMLVQTAAFDRDGEGSRELPPARMPSFDAARKEAIRCAIDLLADLQPGTDDLSGWLVRVRELTSELLLTISVQEAEAARQATADPVGSG